MFYEKDDGRMIEGYLTIKEIGEKSQKNLKNDILCPSYLLLCS